MSYEVYKSVEVTDKILHKCPQKWVILKGKDICKNKAVKLNKIICKCNYHQNGLII